MLFRSNSHPLSRRASITLAELLASPVILTGKDSSVREIVEDGLKREKLALTIDYETNYMSTAVGLVQAGLGIAILPEAAAEMDRSGEISCIVIHAPSLSRKIEVLQRRDRALSPSASRMVEILKEVVGHSA